MIVPVEFGGMMYARARTALSILIVGIVAFSTLGICLDAAASSAAADQKFRERRVIAHWHVTQKRPLELARKYSIDVLEEHPDLRNGYLTILTSDAQLAELRQEGLDIEVTDPDWYSSYAAKVQVPNGGFRTLDQGLALMDSIATNYPLITNKFFMGSTYEGRLMWAMKISDNPTVDEDEEEVLFTGMHHAREPIGFEICLETMRRLTDGYGTDTLITRLVNEREIYFIPCANPDGYEYNRFQSPGGGGMWRKNRQENLDFTIGVDLNRNYGYQWGYDDGGSSPFPSDETYRGTAPFSEPETQAIRNFVNSRNFVFMINYHSYSNLYLWPWGYDRIYTPHDEFFSAVAESMATYTGFKPEIGWTLYPTNGDSDDWAYGATSEHSQIFAFTPEVGTWFWPDPPEIPTLIDESQGPNLVIIDLAENPDRIYPPRVPLWLTPDTVPSADFELTWSDTASTNPAVSYRLEELVAPYEATDDVESGTGLWDVQGMTVTTARSSSGTHSYFGGSTSQTSNRLVSAEQRLVQAADSLRMNLWYAIEVDWDYAYVEVSADGGRTFVSLPGAITTNYNPNGNNRGNGITGSSPGWIAAAFDLSTYAGEWILVRLSYETDAAVLGEGIYFDDIGRLVGYVSVTELAAAVPDTFHAITGATGGVHTYRIQAKDSQGQKSLQSSPRDVFVMAALPGDLDANGVRDVVDLTWLIDFVFAGGSGAVVSGTEECNGEAGVNVMDIVYLLDHVFRGGPPPIGLP